MIENERLWRRKSVESYCNYHAQSNIKKSKEFKDSVKRAKKVLNGR